MRRSKTQGFSLIELMIVVAIIGILAAIAIPSFRSYVYRSRTAEGYAFLGEIRQRQESYRAEFGQYCAVGAYPRGAPSPGDELVGWPGTDPAWNQLGAVPDGRVRFVYQAEAMLGICARGQNAQDFNYCASACADLDDDGALMDIQTGSGWQRWFVGEGPCGGRNADFLASGWE